MIILRQREYSLKERLQAITDGAVIGATTSLIFAVPVGIITKLAGGSFTKGAGYTTLGGAILGALLGNFAYSADKRMKEYVDWREKNKKSLEDLVKKNLPPKMNNLQEFRKKSERLNEEVDYCGYEVKVGGTVGDLVDILAPVLYKSYKDKPLPEEHPIPIIEMWSDIDLRGKAWILWYDKKTGWIHEGKQISGPKEFALDCIENKIDVFEVEDEGWFPEYKEEFLELIKKYLW